MESAWDAKVPGIGCQLHVIERLEDAAMRVAHGPTVSPEEGVSKVLRSWMNSPLPKQTHNVNKSTPIWCDGAVMQIVLVTEQRMHNRFIGTYCCPTISPLAIHNNPDSMHVFCTCT